VNSPERLHGYSGSMRGVATAVVVLTVGLAVIACGSSTDEAMQTTDASSDSIAASAERKPAPRLDGETLDGDPIGVADYRGRPVLINVWSSW
jgi:hypothetical protein